MSATSTQPRAWAWLTQLVSGRPHQIIGGADDPYLLRWYIIPRNRWLNVYVHKFLRSDDDRALHDHPWWFVSLVLRGGYLEISETAAGKLTAFTRIAPDWTRPWVHRGLGWRALAGRRASYRHRVKLLPAVEHGNAYIARRDRRELPCWTLIVTGPRSRGWGFWCPGERFVPWRQWGAGGCGEA